MWRRKWFYRFALLFSFYMFLYKRRLPINSELPVYESTHTQGYSDRKKRRHFKAVIRYGRKAWQTSTHFSYGSKWIAYKKLQFSSWLFQLEDVLTWKGQRESVWRAIAKRERERNIQMDFHRSWSEPKRFFSSSHTHTHAHIQHTIFFPLVRVERKWMQESMIERKACFSLSSSASVCPKWFMLSIPAIFYSISLACSMSRATHAIHASILTGLK